MPGIIQLLSDKMFFPLLSRYKNCKQKAVLVTPDRYMGVQDLPNPLIWNIIYEYQNEETRVRTYMSFHDQVLDTLHGKWRCCWHQFGKHAHSFRASPTVRTWIYWYFCICSKNGKWLKFYYWNIKQSKYNVPITDYW